VAQLAGNHDAKQSGAARVLGDAAHLEAKASLKPSDSTVSLPQGPICVLVYTLPVGHMAPQSKGLGSNFFFFGHIIATRGIPEQTTQTSCLFKSLQTHFVAEGYPNDVFTIKLQAFSSLRRTFQKYFKASGENTISKFSNRRTHLSIT
jgi:hypothetical protein